MVNGLRSRGSLDDDGNRDGFNLVPKEGGKNRTGQQNDDQHVLELGENEPPRGNAAGRLQFIWTVFCQAARRFL